MSKFDLEGFLPYQLSVVASRISKAFSILYKQKFGISIAEWRVVAHLSQAGTVSVREIHERVDMDKSKVSRAAKRLVLAGFVSKRADPDDGRLVSLSLTDKGDAMIKELTPLAIQFEQEVMKSLGCDAKTFRNALAKLLDLQNFRA